jgi:hypothetical protein
MEMQRKPATAVRRILKERSARPRSSKPTTRLHVPRMCAKTDSVSDRARLLMPASSGTQLRARDRLCECARRVRHVV